MKDKKLIGILNDSVTRYAAFEYENKFTIHGIPIQLLLGDVLDLINRQKAEIERLQAMVNAELDPIHKLGDDYERALEEEQELVKKARTDAIHEFAGILRSECRQDQFGFYYVLIDHITHLEKQLTEFEIINHDSLCETETYKVKGGAE